MLKCYAARVLPLVVLPLHCIQQKGKLVCLCALVLCLLHKPLVSQKEAKGNKHRAYIQHRLAGWPAWLCMYVFAKGNCCTRDAVGRMMGSCVVCCYFSSFLPAAHCKRAFFPARPRPRLLAVHAGLWVHTFSAPHFHTLPWVREGVSVSFFAWARAHGTETGEWVVLEPICGESRFRLSGFWDDVTAQHNAWIMCVCVCVFVFPFNRYVRLGSNRNWAFGCHSPAQCAHCLMCNRTIRGRSVSIWTNDGVCGGGGFPILGTTIERTPSSLSFKKNHFSKPLDSVLMGAWLNCAPHTLYICFRSTSFYVESKFYHTIKAFISIIKRKFACIALSVGQSCMHADERKEVCRKLK